MPDVNFQSYYDRHNETLEWTVPTIVDPLAYSDILKFSKCSNIVLHVYGLLPGGKEDCIDMNNGCECVRVVCHGGLAPNGKHAITIKGGSKDCSVKGHLVSHGTEVDVDLGNYSDQSSEITEGVVLDLTASNPVTWRRLNAKTPHLFGGPYRRVFRIPGFFRGLFQPIYRLLKRWGVAK